MPRHDARYPVRPLLPQIAVPLRPFLPQITYRQLFFMLVRGFFQKRTLRTALFHVKRFVWPLPNPLNGIRHRTNRQLATFSLAQPCGASRARVGQSVKGRTMNPNQSAAAFAFAFEKIGKSMYQCDGSGCAEEQIGAECRHSGDSDGSRANADMRTGTDNIEVRSGV